MAINWQCVKEMTFITDQRVAVRVEERARELRWMARLILKEVAEAKAITRTVREE